jgi:hypothetical protein
MKENYVTTIQTVGKENSKKENILNLLHTHFGLNPEKVILEEISLPKRSINWKLTKDDFFFMFLIFIILGGITGLIIGVIIGKIILYLGIGILLGIFLTLVFIFGKFYYKENGTLQLGRRNPPEEHKFIIYEKKEK